MMYRPPCDCRKKLRAGRQVCANVFGLLLELSAPGHFTVLDDLNEASLARLSADGFDPCAVVETSVGNFQAWLKHSTVLPKLVGIQSPAWKTI
jgi:hypothetical protein